MIYDLAIIGGGPAGYSAAFKAAEYGMKTIIFEKENFGGTCLNHGCVPTKFLAHSADIMSQIRHGERYGIYNTNPVLDYSVTYKSMTELVQGIRRELVESYTDSSVEIVFGEAILEDSHHIRAENKIYETKFVLLASGTQPADPIVDGAFTSNDLLALEEIPQKLAIIGGGVVAVEFADIFAKLGSEVRLYIRSKRLLNKWDKDLAKAVMLLLKSEGVSVFTESDFQDIPEDFLVLSAAGRKIELEYCKIDLSLDSKGAILTDPLGRTNIDNIFAAGDVISGSDMLSHTAMEQGRRAVEVMFGKRPDNISVSAGCLYLNPEIATVGLTEQQAEEMGKEVLSGKYNMHSNASTQIVGQSRAYVKIIADKETHVIVGAQLMCDRASDLISEFVLMINKKIRCEDICHSIYPHPSFSEAIHAAAEILLAKF